MISWSGGRKCHETSTKKLSPIYTHLLGEWGGEGFLENAVYTHAHKFCVKFPRWCIM